MSKHTPGPWIFASVWPAEWDSPYQNDSQTSSATAVADSDGNVVAMSVIAYDEWSNPTKDAELIANAYLIAAAPELLEALGTLLNRLEGIGGEHVTGMEGVDADLMKANAAIAKATGAKT